MRISRTCRVTAGKPGLPEGAFEVTSHDDIVPLIERVGAPGVLPGEEPAQLTIGLKLFGGVHMAHRREPPVRGAASPFPGLREAARGRRAGQGRWPPAARRFPLPQAEEG